MKQLIRFIIASALLASFSYDLAGQNTRPTSTRRVHTGTSTKVKRLISYNESGAVSILRTISSAEATYQSTSGNGNYGTLEQLGDQVLIDSILAKGHRYGYIFKLRIRRASSESAASFVALAVPRKYGRTGLRSFYINETGVMRAADRRGAEATVHDDPLDP
ncbi:MAG TPA: hypothetical protein VK619_16455 [Pyrinomonadaceae bacterium]|nr:hypothetical protein [Pyrinomonadaceae bacterium]